MKPLFAIPAFRRLVGAWSIGNLAGIALLLQLVRGPSELWLSYVVAFAYGTLGILNGAAQSDLVRDLLPDEHLDAANGMLATIDQGLQIFTPLAGAALYTLWGGGVLALGVAGFLLLTAALLFTVQVRESDADEPAGCRQHPGRGHRRPDDAPARLQGCTATANMALNIPQLVSTAAGAVLVAVLDYRWLMLVAGRVISACAASML